MNDEVTLDFGEYKGQPIRKVPTRLLKRYHGEQRGMNAVVADELRGRGLNTTQLRQVEWDHSQSLWRQSAEETRIVRAKRRKSTRNKKRQRRLKRRREARLEARLRVMRGVTVVGEKYIVQSDDSCPFDGKAVGNKHEETQE